MKLDNKSRLPKHLNLVMIFLCAIISIFGCEYSDSTRVSDKGICRITSKWYSLVGHVLPPMICEYRYCYESSQKGEVILVWDNANVFQDSCYKYNLGDTIKMCKHGE